MSPNKDSGTAVVVGVGAERGLGAALCRRFGAEGYHVLVAGRTPEKLAQVVKTIGAAGGSAEAITVDTTREDDVSFASLIGRSRPAMAARRPMWSSSTPATTGASISRS
jgi:NAD(P)-dependent dehydrogenase (short-subunit alcohol dehydrogenase family)